MHGPNDAKESSLTLEQYQLALDRARDLRAQEIVRLIKLVQDKSIDTIHRLRRATREFGRLKILQKAA